MPQKWIDNLDTVTLIALSASAEPHLSELVGGASLARLQALLVEPVDWVELVLLGADGSYETLRYVTGATAQRSWMSGGAAPGVWPQGTRIVAAYSAATANRLGALVRSVAYSSSDTLDLTKPVGAFAWSPAGVATPTISAQWQASMTDGDESINIEVQLTSPNSAAPLAIQIVGPPQFVRLPAGAVGTYDAGEEAYSATLPAAARYRLRFEGAATCVLEISDYSEYVTLY